MNQTQKELLVAVNRRSQLRLAIIGKMSEFSSLLSRTATNKGMFDEHLNELTELIHDYNAMDAAAEVLVEKQVNESGFNDKRSIKERNEAED